MVCRLLVITLSHHLLLPSPFVCVDVSVCFSPPHPIPLHLPRLTVSLCMDAIVVWSTVLKWKKKCWGGVEEYSLNTAFKIFNTYYMYCFFLFFCVTRLWLCLLQFQINDHKSKKLPAHLSQELTEDHHWSDSTLLIHQDIKKTITVSAQRKTVYMKCLTIFFFCSFLQFLSSQW